MSTASEQHSPYYLHADANTVEAVLRQLNTYERNPEGKPLTASDLLAFPEALKVAAAGTLDRDGMPYDLTGFHPLSLFVSAVAAVDWLSGLTAKGFEDALRDEVLTGWFDEQDPNAEDEEFMSTPCVDCTAFDFEEVDSGLHDCARGGLLLITPYMRRA